MARNSVHVREAIPADAEQLLIVWSDLGRRQTDERAALEDAGRSVARIAADADERLVVATIGEDVVGAVHLRRAPISPTVSDWAVHVSHLNVRPEFRRHGVGSLLMESAVAWAEEKDISHVLAASASGSRNANRFMARLGLGQVAVVRVATTATLRAKLPTELGGRRPRAGSRNAKVGQVLAARRSLRRLHPDA